MNLSAVERKTRLIGATLVERGLITPTQLKEALELQADRGGLLGEIVTAEFGVSQLEVSQVIAEQLAQLETGIEAGGGPPPQARPQLRQVARSDDGEAYVRVGDALQELGLVSRAQIDAALEQQQQTGERLGEILVAMGVISRLELAGALSEHWSSLSKLRGPGEPGPPVEVETPWATAREFEALATLIGDLDAKLDAMQSRDGGEVAAHVQRLSVKIDGLASAPSELATQVERLSVRLDELVAAVPSDDETRARLDAIAGVAAGDRELAAQVERLSDRVDELLAARSAEHVAVELADQVERLSVKVDELASAPPDLAAQVERLWVRLDELVAAVPSDQIGALGEGQRRSEDMLDRLVSELALLREESDARFGEIASAEASTAQVPADERAALTAALEGVSARHEERAAGRDRELTEQVERLSARVGELAAGGLTGRLSDRIEALADAQRRGEETLQRLLTEVATASQQDEATSSPTDLAVDSPRALPATTKPKKHKKHKKS